MEMSTVIQSLNELEKLKLLLFDEDQYYIFEHIPKPFLIDPNAMKDGVNEEDDDSEEMEFDMNPDTICTNCHEKLSVHDSLPTEWKTMSPTQKKAQIQNNKDLHKKDLAVCKIDNQGNMNCIVEHKHNVRLISLTLVQKGTTVKHCKGYPPLKIEPKSKKKRKEEIIMSQNGFWDKNDSIDQKIKNFTRALNNIKSKEELNVIDQRLLNIMNQFDEEAESSSEEEVETTSTHQGNQVEVQGEGDGLV